MGKESQPERDVHGDRAADVHGEERIRCAACGHALAEPRARIEVDGWHVHTFVNPAGIEFTIRCFAAAPGCAPEGDSSTFWTWFPGHAWRLSLCGGCRGHVGWSFAAETATFWGLVADRIRP